MRVNLSREIAGGDRRENPRRLRERWCLYMWREKVVWKTFELAIIVVLFEREREGGGSG